jgi:ribosomal protein S18 acetylase RimI-like enzyme
MTISPATQAELTEAFALLYGPAGDTRHAFRMVARGELDPGGLLVARRDRGLVGAVFVERLSGGVAVIWPPGVAEPELEDTLTAAALAHVAGVKAVQAFLPPKEVGRATPLVRAGFQHVTRVWQMERASVESEPGRYSEPWRLGAPLQRPSIEVKEYADCDPELVDNTLLRAHGDSLDCPELNNVLTPDEILAGHRDSTSDTSRWRLAVADGQPAGVLLLNGDELTFLGVVPERRGRGVGRRLLDFALDLAPRMSLIVDVRNEPAIRLYRSARFEVIRTREVFLHFPASAAGTTDTKQRRS